MAKSNLKPRKAVIGKNKNGGGNLRNRTVPEGHFLQPHVDVLITKIARLREKVAASQKKRQEEDSRRDDGDGGGDTDYDELPGSVTKISKKRGKRGKKGEEDDGKLMGNEDEKRLVVELQKLQGLERVLKQVMERFEIDAKGKGKGKAKKGSKFDFLRPLLIKNNTTSTTSTSTSLNLNTNLVQFHPTHPEISIPITVQILQRLVFQDSLGDDDDDSEVEKWLVCGLDGMATFLQDDHPEKSTCRKSFFPHLLPLFSSLLEADVNLDGNPSLEKEEKPKCKKGVTDLVRRKALGIISLCIQKNKPNKELLISDGFGKKRLGRLIANGGDFLTTQNSLEIALRVLQIFPKSKSNSKRNPISKSNNSSNNSGDNSLRLRDDYLSEVFDKRWFDGNLERTAELRKRVDETRLEDWTGLNEIGCLNLISEVDISKFQLLPLTHLHLSSPFSHIFHNQLSLPSPPPSPHPGNPSNPKPSEQEEIFWLGINKRSFVVIVSEWENDGEKQDQDQEGLVEQVVEWEVDNIEKLEVVKDSTNPEIFTLVFTLKSFPNGCPSQPVPSTSPKVKESPIIKLEMIVRSKPGFEEIIVGWKKIKDILEDREINWTVPSPPKNLTVGPSKSAIVPKKISATTSHKAKPNLVEASKKRPAEESVDDGSQKKRKKDADDSDWEVMVQTIPQHNEPTSKGTKNGDGKETSKGKSVSFMPPQPTVLQSESQKKLDLGKRQIQQHDMSVSKGLSPPPPASQWKNINRIGGDNGDLDEVLEDAIEDSQMDYDDSGPVPMDVDNRVPPNVSTTSIAIVRQQRPHIIDVVGEQNSFQGVATSTPSFNRRTDFNYGVNEMHNEGNSKKGAAVDTTSFDWEQKFGLRHGNEGRKHERGDEGEGEVNRDGKEDVTEEAGRESDKENSREVLDEDWEWQDDVFIPRASTLSKDPNKVLPTSLRPPPATSSPALNQVFKPKFKLHSKPERHVGEPDSRFTHISNIKIPNGDLEFLFESKMMIAEYARGARDAGKYGRVQGMGMGGHKTQSGGVVSKSKTDRDGKSNGRYHRTFDVDQDMSPRPFAGEEKLRECVTAIAQVVLDRTHESTENVKKNGHLIRTGLARRVMDILEDLSAQTSEIIALTFARQQLFSKYSTGLAKSVKVAKEQVIQTEAAKDRCLDSKGKGKGKQNNEQDGRMMGVCKVAWNEEVLSWCE